jgi:hypothetical protein
MWGRDRTLLSSLITGFPFSSSSIPSKASKLPIVRLIVTSVSAGPSAAELLDALGVSASTSLEAEAFACCLSAVASRP